MEPRDVLEQYRGVVLEMHAIRQQRDKLMPSGAPRGTENQRITGMPRGTNDPVASAYQQADRCTEILTRKMREAQALAEEFERIVERVAAVRDRVIIRRYYALGDTDGQIADDLGLDRRTVCMRRGEIVKNL